MSFSPRGDQILTSSLDGTCRIWDASSGEVADTLVPPSTSLSASAPPEPAKVGDRYKGAPAKLQFHDAAWSPVGRRVAGGGTDGRVYIWDLHVAGGLGSNCEVAPTRSAASDNRTLEIPALGDPESYATHDRLPLHPVRCVAFSPDGAKLAAAAASCIAFWAVAPGGRLHLDGVVLKVDQPCAAVSWAPSPCDLIAFAAGNKEASTIEVWDFKDFAKVAAPKSEAETAPNITTAGSGLAKMPKPNVLLTMDGRVKRIAWSPDGNRIAVASSGDHPIRFFTRPPVLTPTAQGAGSTSAENAPQDPPKAWDSTNLNNLDGKVSGRCVAWSPDGTRLASTTDSAEVRVVQILKNSPRLRPFPALSGHTDSVSGIAWSPLGDRVATSSDDGTVRCWDAIASTRSGDFAGHESGITDVKWSPDDNFLATASNDKHVKVWRAGTGDCLRTLSRHEPLHRVFQLAWFQPPNSPDDNRELKLFSLDWGSNVVEHTWKRADPSSEPDVRLVEGSKKEDVLRDHFKAGPRHAGPKKVTCSLGPPPARWVEPVASLLPALGLGGPSWATTANKSASEAGHGWGRVVLPAGLMPLAAHIAISKPPTESQRGEANMLVICIEGRVLRYTAPIRIAAGPH